MSDPKNVQFDPEQSFVLSLPASVCEIVQCELEWAEQVKNPSEILSRNYREWEDATSPEVKCWGKGITTCFEGCCGDPTLLYWTLEHYSDVFFPLTQQQKKDLMFHTFNEAESIRSLNVCQLKSTETTDSLEYCWYFLVRLLAIENGLVTRQNHPSPQLKKHLGFIYCHYGLLLRDVTQYHELGWITTASPKEDIESKLIELVRKYTHLRPVATHLIAAWEELESNAEVLQRLIDARSERLSGVGKDPFDEAEEREDDPAEQVNKQGRVMHQLRCLETIMSPESEDDPVWHHPVEFIEKLAEGKHVIFLKPAIAAFKDENLSNGQRFELH